MQKRIFSGLALLLMLITGAVAQTYVVRIRPSGSRLWGYANQTGEVIILPVFKVCGPFSSDGVAATFDPDKKTLTYIDLTGKRVAEFRLTHFDPSWKFDSGLGLALTTVENRDGIKDKVVLGYIDVSGTVVIPCRYDKANEFHDGFAVAKKEKQLVLLNAKGEEIQVEPSIDVIRHFSEGLAPCVVERRFGFVDVRGKIAIRPNFLGVGYFVNGLASAKTDEGLTGYIDKTGEWVIEPQFDEGKDFDSLSGLARIRLGNRWNYINGTGKIVSMASALSLYRKFNINDDTQPGKKGNAFLADVLGDFSGGLANGKWGMRWGFLDTEGQWAIEPQFERVRAFKNGFAAVRIHGKWGVINKKGDWVIKPDFEEMGDMELVN